ncbi:MAG: metallophosphoesterase [Anaerolineae bacterium]|nr:metallophosphoesterase [Anaerolineae bacterium]
MNILAISDIELPEMQNIPYVERKYGDVNLVISCGDLNAAYIEFVTTILGQPLYYVRGNHDTQYAERAPGGMDLHGRFMRYRGLWMAGLEGSRRYNRGPIQYSESQMLAQVLGMAPGMLLRRARWGAGVDVMVTHASPRYIHDREDIPHQGFRAFRLLIRWFRPRYLIHGHVDIYDRRDVTWTDYFGTQVVNINPVRKLTVEVYRRRLIGRSQVMRS